MYRSVHEAKSAAGGRRGEHRQAGAAPADLAGAREALDRIAIPKEASDRIAEIVGPGASLIVSDEPANRETGAATEFIVVMSTEPQGGLRSAVAPRRWRRATASSAPATAAPRSAGAAPRSCGGSRSRERVSPPAAPRPALSQAESGCPLTPAWPAARSPGSPARRPGA